MTTTRQGRVHTFPFDANNPTLMSHNTPAAHELRAWLLHYSPVVLQGFLHKDFYQHHLLLVEGIYLHLKDLVEKDDIAWSAKLFNHYCYLFPALDGV